MNNPGVARLVAQETQVLLASSLLALVSLLVYRRRHNGKNPETPLGMLYAWQVANFATGRTSAVLRGLCGWLAFSLYVVFLVVVAHMFLLKMKADPSFKMQ